MNPPAAPTCMRCTTSTHSRQLLHLSMPLVTPPVHERGSSFVKVLSTWINQNCAISQALRGRHHQHKFSSEKHHTCVRICADNLQYGMKCKWNSKEPTSCPFMHVLHHVNSRRSRVLTLHHDSGLSNHSCKALINFKTSLCGECNETTVPYPINSILGMK